MVVLQAYMLFCVVGVLGGVLVGVLGVVGVLGGVLVGVLVGVLGVLGVVGVLGGVLGVLGVVGGGGGGGGLVVGGGGGGFGREVDEDEGRLTEPPARRSSRPWSQSRLRRRPDDAAHLTLSASQAPSEVPQVAQPELAQVGSGHDEQPQLVTWQPLPQLPKVSAHLQLLHLEKTNWVSETCMHGWHGDGELCDARSYLKVAF